jgi:hypothetical protein
LAAEPIVTEADGEFNLHAVIVHGHQRRLLVGADAWHQRDGRTDLKFELAEVERNVEPHWSPSMGLAVWAMRA